MLPEPRWVTCAACIGRVDRHEPHVTSPWQLEVLAPDGHLHVLDAHPGKTFHLACAPAEWTGLTRPSVNPTPKETRTP